MPRPFRYRPPSLPDHALARPQLLERLAQRWDHRVVTLVAGPGFGKTILLAAVMVGDVSGGRQDVWLSCEPADESADHLVAGLAQALTLQAGADVDAVLDEVWSRAPAEVCFVFDDVHEIPAGSTGAAALQRLAADLAANGHLVLASRDTIPVPLARFAAGGQLVRIAEDDLLFNQAELDALAAARGVDPAMLASTGGWPALAELIISAGSDLVFEYLWEEVLTRVGPSRAALLARFAAVGGGDDELAAAVAGPAVSVGEIVASIPLVARSADGWAALHPLWNPALRPLLTAEEAADARRRAAEVHRRRGRYDAAIDLLVEAEDWDGVLDTIRDADEHAASLTPADFGRWHRVLPPQWHAQPATLLARALELQARAPAEATTTLRAAAEAWRSNGDVEGELAAIGREGYLRWLTNDVAGLLALYARVGELAAAGSERAQQLQGIAVAALAHLQGDSATVLSALSGFDDPDSPWHPMICWLRSVAHRRDGDLGRAHTDLDRCPDVHGRRDIQRDIARLRIEWLEGRVDHVCEGLADFHATYIQSNEQYLAKETGLELAGKLAWLGDATAAREVLAASASLVPEITNTVCEVLETVARAALAVAEGDEPAAAALLEKETGSGPAALGSPQSWYWRDRAAVSLVHVLVPATRDPWTREALGAAHRPGLVLAEALEAERAGDLDPVRQLRWPDAGVVRAHVPVPWVVELAAAATAVGNPPPDELLRSIGERARSALRAVAATSSVGSVRTAAKQLAKNLPTEPAYRLRIAVLGPLEVRRDGALVDDPALRRQRVRELLCYLVVRHRVQREVIAEELFPDVADPAHNLRVTLNHLQRALEPDRAEGRLPYFLRTSGSWLELVEEPRLEIDSWELEARLEEADAAERGGAPTTALDAYRKALPLWRGEPFADAAYALWAEPDRARLRRRYVTAAVRAGELLLASRAVDEARRAADFAIQADPTAEPAYRLLARAHLADHDVSGAHTALQACRTALAELGVEPDATTAALVASISA